MQGSENASGEVTVGGFNITPTSSSGILVNLRFDVQASANGTGPLALSSFTDDLALATTTNGEMSVSQATQSLSFNGNISLKGSQVVTASATNSVSASFPPKRLPPGTSALENG